MFGYGETRYHTFLKKNQQSWRAIRGNHLALNHCKTSVSSYFQFPSSSFVCNWSLRIQWDQFVLGCVHSHNSPPSPFLSNVVKWGDTVCLLGSANFAIVSKRPCPFPLPPKVRSIIPWEYSYDYYRQVPRAYWLNDLRSSLFSAFIVRQR